MRTEDVDDSQDDYEESSEEESEDEDDEDDEVPEPSAKDKGKAREAPGAEHVDQDFEYASIPSR